MDRVLFINRSAFFLGAILICLSGLFYTLIQRAIRRPKTRLYIIMMIVIIFSSVSEMLVIFFQLYAERSLFSRVVVEVSMFLYFLVHTFLALAAIYYAMFATEFFRRLTAVGHTILIVPFAVSEILVITNPVFHFVWYFDEEYGFHRNWGETILYGMAVVFFLFQMYLVLIRWYAVTSKRRAILIVSYVAVAAGILTQFFLPELQIELFAEAICQIGFLLAIEYEDDRKDSLTGFYNRAAFMQDMRYLYKYNTDFSVVCLQIHDLDVYQRMPDSLPIRDVFSTLSAELCKIYPGYLIYRVNNSAFALILHTRNKKKISQLPEKVQKLFLETLPERIGDHRIKGSIVYADVPNELPTITDIMLLCDNFAKQEENGEILSREKLKDIFDQAAVERAIIRGIEKNNFEVFYQLVYTTDKREIHSAEALLRLNDPELGMVMPDTFIPIAERTGFIDKLGDLVLNTVCEFWKTGYPEQLGIRYINVNLSMIQCMQPNFVQHMNAIIRNQAVDPYRICFEITESVAANDYRRLSEVVAACRERGFLFSMEGYGTGYSNLYSVLSLKFDEIKLDRTLIWEAEKTESGRIILENSIRMIHDLNIPVVAVGIEGEVHLARAKGLGVDLIQGFYMSEPMTAREICSLRGGKDE